jgi:cell division initiation protein
MLTPQEVSEHAFAKASFGGYNMAMVDEFLDVLTADYTTLYKENATLKAKMKVLVEKVEEYRSTEDAMRKALLTAQKMADEMVAQAEQKKAELLRQAEADAKARVEALRHEVDSEQLRLTAAQNATAAYVAKLKELYQHEMDYLSSLSHLSAPAPAAPDPVSTAAQDIQSSVEKLVEKEIVPPEDPEDTRDLGDKLQGQAPAKEPDGGLYAELMELSLHRSPAEEESRQRPGRRVLEEEPEEDRDEEPTRRIDFEHLQFGKDYEIK